MKVSKFKVERRRMAREMPEPDPEEQDYYANPSAYGPQSTFPQCIEAARLGVWGNGTRRHYALPGCA